MEKSLSLILVFLLPIYGLTQTARQNPLTQAEYVRLLYSLQSNPADKESLVEAIRKRGIDFMLTRGLRSLTISKSGNDAELQRALEEANRRRENPTLSKLPSRMEAFQLLEKTRQNTLASVEEMPDFIVKQRIKRSVAFAGTNKFKNLDRLVVAVSYLSHGQEKYKILSINGVRQSNPESKSGYSEAKGVSSTGEFVSVLAAIFKIDNEAKFELVGTDLIRNRRTAVFDFSIEKDKAKQLLTSHYYITDSTITGSKGRIWVDREKACVLRVESEATEIPLDFPIRSAKRTISYAWVKINEINYLLPSLSDVRLISMQRDEMYESRNLIHFKDYKKYGSEIVILDDDDSEIEEENSKTDK